MKNLIAATILSVTSLSAIAGDFESSLPLACTTDNQSMFNTLAQNGYNVPVSVNDFGAADGMLLKLYQVADKKGNTALVLKDNKNNFCFVGIRKSDKVM